MLITFGADDFLDFMLTYFLELGGMIFERIYAFYIAEGLGGALDDLVDMFEGDDDDDDEDDDDEDDDDDDGDDESEEDDEEEDEDKEEGSNNSDDDDTNGPVVVDHVQFKDYPDDNEGEVKVFIF
jgi:hypothetical protein